MGGFSEAARNGWLDDLVNGDRYLALYVGDPASGGAELSESNYERKQVLASDWNAASGGTKTNKNTISFVKSDDVWSSENVTHFAIFDQASGGNMLGWDDFPSNQQQPIMAENTVQFAAGNIQLIIE